MQSPHPQKVQEHLKPESTVTKPEAISTKKELNIVRFWGLTWVRMREGDHSHPDKFERLVLRAIVCSSLIITAWEIIKDHLKL